MEKAKQDQKIMEMTAPPESEFKAAESRKFSSTQIQLPPVLAQELLDLGKSIPAFDLCVEEGGLEEDAHITVKYGLHTNDAADVRKVLATYVGPIRITLGKTNVFAGPEYDVLYVEVFSQDLKDLNQRLEGSLENTTTHPVYTPHATVAYLKTGLGVKYVGLTKLEGMSATIGSVRFSSSLGEIVDLRVTGRNEKGTFAVAEAAEDVELVGLLSAAIEAGDEEMVGRIVGLKK
jgi:2'-5' RNA ligase